MITQIWWTLPIYYLENLKHAGTYGVAKDDEVAEARTNQLEANQMAVELEGEECFVDLS